MLDTVKRIKVSAYISLFGDNLFILKDGKKYVTKLFIYSVKYFLFHVKLLHVKKKNYIALSLNLTLYPINDGELPRGRTLRKSQRLCILLYLDREDPRARFRYYVFASKLKVLRYVLRAKDAGARRDVGHSTYVCA